MSIQRPLAGKLSLERMQEQEEGPGLSHFSKAHEKCMPLFRLGAAVTVMSWQETEPQTVRLMMKSNQNKATLDRIYIRKASSTCPLVLLFMWTEIISLCRDVPGTETQSELEQSC